jgi:hypothetical protein
MILKSAKPKTPFTFLRWLFVFPAIASLAMMFWLIWHVLPYFFLMAFCGLIFQISFAGLEPLFKKSWFA